MLIVFSLGPGHRRPVPGALDDARPGRQGSVPGIPDAGRDRSGRDARPSRIPAYAGSPASREVKALRFVKLLQDGRETWWKVEPDAEPEAVTASGNPVRGHARPTGARSSTAPPPPRRTRFAQVGQHGSHRREDRARRPRREASDPFKFLSLIGDSRRPGSSCGRTPRFRRRRRQSDRLLPGPHAREQDPAARPEVQGRGDADSTGSTSSR